MSANNGKSETLAERIRRYQGTQGTQSTQGVTVTSTVNVLQEQEPVLPPAPSWPAPLEEAAYHGLAGQIVRLIEPQTEADPVAVLAQLLVMFGHALGRTAHFKVEEDRHYANLFCCLVGETAKGRKGTSKGRALAAFSALDESYKLRLASGLSSGEGLLWAVRDERWEKQGIKSKGRVVDYQQVLVDEGVADKRLLAIESEFVLVLRSSAREGNTLSARLREAWDTGHLNLLTKTAAAKATNAHISLVGHITRSELARTLSETDTVNGFANRFLWLAVRRSQLLPLGGKAVDLGSLAHKLALAVEEAHGRQEIGLTPEAEDLWCDVLYPQLAQGLPGLLGQVTNRAEAQVRRLALCYALLDFAGDVDVQHLRAAHALWNFSQRSCAWIFGSSTGNPDADELLDALQAAGEQGLNLTQISAVFGRHKTARQLRELLSFLEEHHLVIPGRPATGGNPAIPWKSANPANAENAYTG